MQQIDFNNLISTFRKKDDEINELLDAIVATTDLFEKDMQKNLQRVFSLEFNMVRLRALVTKELTYLKAYLNNEVGLPPHAVGEIKKREIHLVSLNTRITDMREDFNAVQKMAYQCRVSSL